MTLIPKLIKYCTEGESSITLILTHALFLATKLGDDALEWVEKEQHGYPKGTDLPAYRKVTARVCIRLGRRRLSLPGERREFRFTAVELERLSKRTVDIYYEESGTVVDEFEQEYVAPVRFTYSPANFAAVIDQIKLRTLKWASELQLRGFEVEDSLSQREDKFMQGKNIHITNTFGPQASVGVIGQVDRSEVSVTTTMTETDVENIAKIISAIRSEVLGHAGVAGADRIRDAVDRLEALNSAKSDRPKVIEAAHKLIQIAKDSVGTLQGLGLLAMLPT